MAEAAAADGRRTLGEREVEIRVLAASTPDDERRYELCVSSAHGPDMRSIFGLDDSAEAEGWLIEALLWVARTADSRRGAVDQRI